MVSSTPPLEALLLVVDSPARCGPAWPVRWLSRGAAGGRVVHRLLDG